MKFKRFICVIGLFILMGHSIIHGQTNSALETEKTEYMQDFAKIQNMRESLNPQPDKEAFRKDPDGYIKQLRASRDKHDLNAYEQFADTILNKWASKNAEYFGRLALELCKPLSSGNFKDMQQVALARKYALSALEKSEQIPLELELELTGHVTTMTIMPEAPKGQDFAQSRTQDMEVRLHAWQRLFAAIDPNWNPNDLPQSNIAPPEETGLPSGVAPQAIEDPVLRAQYEAALEANRQKAKKYNEQYDLRKWLKRYPQNMETYMIYIYSAPPYNNEELVQFLNDFKFNETTKTKIIKAVAENIKKDTKDEN